MSPTRLQLDKIEPTPQQQYLNRRSFLRKLGYGSLIAAGAGVTGHGVADAKVSQHKALQPGLNSPEILKRFSAPRNKKYDLDVKLTDELVAATHNNFYEFLPGQAGNLWRITENFTTDPWTIEVTGRCRRPRKFDIEDLFTLPGLDHEERTYRFRCVEAWAMDVPWTGFELNKLMAKVEPLSDAKFVRFVTVNRPQQMPGLHSTQGTYPWPYFEALRMDEAMHPLTLMVTGVYGRPLPRQHGAPFRVIVPWKYGYKSPKSIVKIELLSHQPKTFWETMQPDEYPFLSNVNPNVPHPRWSQAFERVIGTRVRRPTQIYNGYANEVAQLYV